MVHRKNMCLDCAYSINYFGKGQKKSKVDINPKTLSVAFQTKKLPIKAIPYGQDKNGFRKITVIKSKFKEIKRAQRIFVKLIEPFITVEQAPYLKSTIKGVSYSDNAQAHSGPRFVLQMDIHDFFGSITRKQVEKTIKEVLHVKKDIAEFYSKLLTSPVENGSKEYVLGQGLPSSPLLAFLCYWDLLDFTYQHALKKGYRMTLYVDDMTFSSETPIEQNFVDFIFGIFKNRGLEIHKEKKKLSIRKPWKNKTITGIVVKQNGTEAKDDIKAHLKIMYQTLLHLINLPPTDDTFFDLMNLSYIFNGYLVYLKQSETKLVGGKPVEIYSSKFPKYASLQNFLKTIIPYGVDKVDSNNKYCKANVGKSQLSNVEDKKAAYFSLTRPLTI